MFGRISFYKTNNDVSTAIAKKESEVNQVQNQISTGNKLQRLSDDPVAAAHATRYASALVRKDVFAKQNRQIYDSMQVAEGYARSAVDILQESRELAVRAANGTFTKSDRENMANSINENIEALYALSNAQDGDGRYMFGGTRTNIPPFRGLRLASNRMNKEVINAVEYAGSNNTGQVRVSDVDVVPRAIAGSSMFWSRESQLRGSVNALGYAAPENAVITVNKVDIPITQGDSIYAVVDKINSSTANVRAFVDTATGGLGLATTGEEQLWISDAQGQTLQDLGVIVADRQPPYNISPDANLFKETVFDSLIRLRDAMFEDDYNVIGGRALAAIDGSLESVLENIGKMGAVSERLDLVYRRMDEKDVPNLTRQLDNQVATDMTEAIQKMSELNTAKSAAYSVGSRIMNTSLLDYLQ